MRVDCLVRIFSFQLKSCMPLRLTKEKILTKIQNYEQNYTIARCLCLILCLGHGHKSAAEMPLSLAAVTIKPCRWYTSYKLIYNSKDSETKRLILIYYIFG